LFLSKAHDSTRQRQSSYGEPCFHGRLSSTRAQSSFAPRESLGLFMKASLTLSLAGGKAQHRSRSQPHCNGRVALFPGVPWKCITLVPSVASTDNVHTYNSVGGIDPSLGARTQKSAGCELLSLLTPNFGSYSLCLRICAHFICGWLIWS
jgi:hypothetical protein